MSGYWREIVSELQEKFQFCVYWGRKDQNGNVLWQDSDNVSGSYYPYWTTHLVQVHQVGDVHNSSSSDAELTWRISLWRNEGLYPPNEVGFTEITSWPRDGYFSQRNWDLANGTNTYTGVYHVRMGKFHVEVPSEGFVADTNVEFVGHRFLCNVDDEPVFSQCRWPDGQEAGIF